MRRLLPLLLVGCHTEPPPAPPLKPAPPAHLAGCADVRPGPVCVRPSGPITVWIDAPADAVPGAEAAGRGARVTLAGAGDVAVTGHHPVQIRVDRAAAGPGRALHARGRQANRAGRSDEAVRLLTQAGERQVADGDLGGAAVTAALLAFIHLDAGRVDAADQALERWPVRREDGDAQSRQAYYAGLIAIAAGDARAALRRLDRGGRWADRLGLPRGRLVAQQRARVFVSLGRAAEAAKILADLPEPADPCGRADLWTNRGWALLASARSAEPRTGQLLAGAVDAYQRCERASATKRANARVNHALWALRAGSPAPTLPPLSPDVAPEVRAWTAYVEAQRGRAAARPDALRRVAELAADAGLQRLRWQALLEEGKAAWTHGDRPRALSRFAAAEAVVATGAFDVPADSGRVAFTTDREASALWLVEALRKMGHARQALAAARRARRRVLTTLPAADAVARLSPQARAQWTRAWRAWQTARQALAREAAQDWALSAEALAQARSAREARRSEVRALFDAAVARLVRPGPAAGAPLAPLRAGEALLLWIRRPGGGWTGFLADAQGVVAEPVIPGRWTAPFRARLVGAAQIRVLSAGPTVGAQLDLPPVAVAHSLDLPPRLAAATPGPVVLVADPTGDLPGARREAKGVTEVLSAALGPVTQVTGPAATLARVRAALGRAGHLHYAGHGRFAGFEGWGSGLPLRDGLLELREVLAAPRVPASLVLSGCETGRAADGAAVGVGLAHAFLIRGAETVVAPVRPVDDRQALVFGQALYAGRRDGASWAQAVARARDASGASDYRLFVP